MKTPNLSDYLNDDEAGEVVLNLSQNLARTRHEDFDDVIAGHEFTDEESSRILNGKNDPGETQYQIAKASNFVSAEEMYDGNGRNTGPKLDPESAEAIYNP
jgi:hypothetical protein